MIAVLSSAPESKVAPPDEGWVLLENISWELYEKLRDEADDRCVRISYDEGRLLLMSPIGHRHEIFKSLISVMIAELAVEWEIPYVAMGSATWKREDIRKALESDECYYIRHALDVMGKDEIDLKRDAPPDLAVEIDITHYPLDRSRIYAGLGVNELWRFNGIRTAFSKLGDDGQYHAIDRSDAFPPLMPIDIDRHLALRATMDHGAVIRTFRQWVRQARLS